MGKAGRVKALREYNENTIVTKQVKIIKRFLANKETDEAPF